MTETLDAAQAGTITLGGELSVNRLGFGAMQLTGKGVWGEPADPDECVRVLRRAVELGVTFIDTADAYGPFVSERLIHKALHPYADGLVIATKVGQTRPGPGAWVPCGRPEYLRQQAELCLRHLGVERIDLLQLHRVDPSVPLADQVGELKKLQDEGKVAHIGMSEVDVDQLAAAREIAEIISVQNMYNLADRDAEPVLQYAAANGIAFIPWFPLKTGKLAGPGSPLASIAQRLGASASQVALAWLLHHSPVMLPIPGTSKVAHLDENVAAAALSLSDSDADELAAATAK